MHRDQAGLSWQMTTWDHMADLYLNENASRMAPVADRAVAHAVLTSGEQVLDLGTGTGIVLERAAPLVGARGAVVGIDISAKMLSIAQQQVTMWRLSNVALRQGRAEAIPAEDDRFDAVIASLILRYGLELSKTTWYGFSRSRGASRPRHPFQEWVRACWQTRALSLNSYRSQA